MQASQGTCQPVHLYERENFVVYYLGKGSGYRAFRIFDPSPQPIGLGTGPQIRKALYLNLLIYKKKTVETSVRQQSKSKLARGPYRVKYPQTGALLLLGPCVKPQPAALTVLGPFLKWARTSTQLTPNPKSLSSICTLSCLRAYYVYLNSVHAQELGMRPKTTTEDDPVLLVLISLPLSFALS